MGLPAAVGNDVQIFSESMQRSRAGDPTLLKSPTFTRHIFVIVQTRAASPEASRHRPPTDSHRVHPSPFKLFTGVEVFNRNRECLGANTTSNRQTPSPATCADRRLQASSTCTLKLRASVYWTLALGGIVCRTAIGTTDAGDAVSGPSHFVYVYVF